jgi:hypothetical protein
MTTTTNETRQQDGGYFGLCPHCRNADGLLNVGSDHWYFCDVHKTKWYVGSKLFSWRDQTEDEQRQHYEAKGFGEYEEVKPVFPPSLIQQRSGPDKR